jgi:hypothetical protein
MHMTRKKGYSFLGKYFLRPPPPSPDNKSGVQVTLAIHFGNNVERPLMSRKRESEARAIRQVLLRCRRPRLIWVLTRDSPSLSLSIQLSTSSRPRVRTFGTLRTFLGTRGEEANQSPASLVCACASPPAPDEISQIKRTSFPCQTRELYSWKRTGAYTCSDVWLYLMGLRVGCVLNTHPRPGCITYYALRARTSIFTIIAFPRIRPIFKDWPLSTFLCLPIRSSSSSSSRFLSNSILYPPSSFCIRFTLHLLYSLRSANSLEYNKLLY